MEVQLDNILNIKKYNKVCRYGNSYTIQFYTEFWFLFESMQTYTRDAISFNNYCIANDYVKNALRPSNKIQCDMFEHIHNRELICKRFKIYTKYNSKIKKLNDKFKKYCKGLHIEYIPYELCIVKHKHECFYHLHNENFFELYEDKCLKSLVNKFEKYINNLIDEGYQPVYVKDKKLSKLEQKRNDLIDNEIERSNEYIKYLKKLKRT